MVRVVGLEPTLCEELDFESSASTIPPYPRTRMIVIATKWTSAKKYYKPLP